MEYNDIFAWSHEDILGINPQIICHQLTIDKRQKLVKQKKRVFNQERYEAIHDEVDKLLKAGFIRKVNYPQWVLNVVMVKKANGKWRMCVNFTDLNKICHKDNFALKD